MNHGLSDETVQRIITVFKDFPEIEKVLLYGSRAKGNFRTGSDIDLSLVGPNLSRDVWSQVFDELDDLLLPYKIDLSIFGNLTHQPLVEHIQRVGQVFYEKRADSIKAS